MGRQAEAPRCFRCGTQGADIGVMTKILVIDDELSVAALLARVLRADGTDVTQAHTAMHAFGLARQDVPDLILLDRSLPDMDGLDACRLLKTDVHLRHIPVIVVSGAAEDEVDWRLAGAAGFIPKPFDIHALALVVRRHLADA